MTNSRKISIISLIVIVALAFALIFTLAVTTVAQAEGPESFAVTLSEEYISAAPWDSEPGAMVGLTFPDDLTFTPAITYDVNDTSNVGANFYAFDSSSSLVILVRKATTDDALLMALFDKGQDLAVTFNGHEQTYHDASNDLGSGVAYYHQYVSDYGTIVISLTDYTDNTYEADTISIQIVISNAAYSAMQGNDPQTPQSGNESAPDVVELHASDIPERDGALVVGDIPDFQAVTLEVAQAWDGVPETGIAMLLYDVTGSDGFAGCFFQDGEYKSSMTTVLNCNAVKDSIGNGYSLFYTRGVVSAQEPAPTANSSIAYMAWDEDSKTVKEVEGGCAEYTVVTTGTKALADGVWYVVSENVTISSRITVSGTVNLILCDGATLTASAGITTTGATLNVYAQSTGENMGAIVATGTGNAAAIGGGYGGNGGNVNIHGGVITATGDEGAAGIGGGDCGNGGNVNIYGGIITATGDEHAGGGCGGAGIGGGEYCNGGIVNIYGGVITATGGEGAAGIGGGDAGSSNGALTVAEGYVVYGGTSADPTNVIEKSNNDYARYQYMIVTVPHTHDYSTDWSSDASTHWHACTAEGECDAPKADEAAHTYAETMTDATYYTCSVCSYVDNDRKAAYDSAMAVAAVKEKIAAIGEVAYTTESKGKIDEAREAYDALTADQQALVETLDTLTAAESAYATLKADSEAADPVEELIDAIGTVTYTTASKNKIDAARAAYDALTESQQAFVANVNTLTAAENTYATLKTNNEAADAVEALIDAIGEVTYTPGSKDKIDAARAAYDALTNAQKALVGNVNTLTDAETDYTILKALDEDPSAHVHDRVVFTAWNSTTSLPGSAGNYYLTGNVSLNGTWNKPGGTVNLCLNGYGIKTTSGRVITMNGGTLSLYDCGTTTHYFDVDSNGKAINVNDESGEKSFKGGYITGGKGGNGLSNTSLYWGEGGGILVWSGTFNMYGGTILGNAAGHGGGVEVVNATMNFYGGNIIYNQAAGNLGFGNKNGEGGAGINLRSQSGNTVTLNMYGGNVCYNKGTAIDQSYCYGNRQFNLYSGNISHNNGTGIWVHNTAIDGDPVIEDNSGNGVLCGVFSIKGTPVIRNNASSNLYVYTDCTITLAGALDIEEPIGVTMRAGTGVFTSGASTLEGDPLSYFYSDSGDYRVVTEGDELKLIEGRTLYINNLQGTIKSVDVEKTDTIASVKATAAILFGVNADEYVLIYEGDDLNESDTVESAGIPGRSTLDFVPIAGGLKTLTLVPTLTTDATEIAPGVYSSFSQGDVITITYASTQNSGFAEAIFTTAFDEEYLHLTAFSVDETYYTILNDYGMEVGNTYVPMTFAQWIAAHNAALDAGEEPYTGRLTLSMAYKNGLLDTTGVLSDHFITVTYTVVKNVPAGTELKFGFDMSLDGMFTNAAYDEDILLNIIDATGATVTEEMITLVVKNPTEVTIPADQVLTFHRSGNNYIVDPADINLTWTEPTFGANETNPYIADGGSVTYTFYVKNGDEYEPIVGVPTAVGDYFVKATLTSTDAYLGYETDYVAITVAKILVDVPDLKLYAGEDSATPTYDDKVLGITKGGVVYGTTLTLKEIVDNAESVYTLPAASGSVDDLTYSFKKADGDNWTVVNNFFSSQPLAVGTYQLTITPKNGDYVAFDADPEVDAITIEITIVKAKVVAPTETTETYTYTGEEQTYEFATAGSDTLYDVENNKRTNAGEQTVTVSLKDSDNYEWEAGGIEDIEFTFTIVKAKVVAPTETVLTYTYSGEEQTYTFETTGSTTLYTVTNDKRTVAGEQTVTVAIKDKDNYEWEAGGVDDLPFTFVINKKKLTVKTYIAGEVEHALTYGDAGPAASAFTYEVEGILAAEEEAILAALDDIFAITAEDVEYEQYAGVGEYVYTTTAGGDLPANYEIEVVETAKIVVSAKELTLTASYLGGTVTLSYSGTVNDDEITVVYSVDGVDLAANTYTAVAADAEKESIVARITTTNPNYAAAEIALKAVYSVTFEVTEAFAGATGMPAAQYVFEGCLATEPDTEPAFDKYLFSYWAKQDVEYDFDTAVEADLVLVAVWQKDVYTYRFYAKRAGAAYSLDGYRVLAWDENDSKFVLGTESAVYEFDNGAALPTDVTLGSFRIHHWVKAIKVEESYVYTTVRTFESAVSVEIDEDAYYIAVMTLDIGMGDVDGDGAISAADVIMMKKFLVGVKYTTLTNEAAVWDTIGGTAPAGGYFYIFLWDANGDTYKDTRDIIVEREALATGYRFEIKSDVTVNDVYYSHEVIVTPDYEVFSGNVAGDLDFVTVDNTSDFLDALSAGKKVGCLADIEIEYNGYLLFDVEEGDIYIDLGGHTLTVDRFQMRAKAGSITVKNGYFAFKDEGGEVILDSTTGLYFSDLIYVETGLPLEVDDEETHIAMVATW